MNTNLQVWWSPHSTADSQRFIKINSRDQELTVYDVLDSSDDDFRFKEYAKYSKIPYMRCFDWSPVDADLVSVGQSSGEALLLRLSNTSTPPVPLAVKQQRSCNSVSFNCNGTQLAIGLDKVRSDFCLNIWDINQRLGSSSDRPVRLLASSEAITSCRFTRDNPQTLVAGVAYRYVRMFDLRESMRDPVITCNSRCVYSLSFDLDPNYFAGYSDEGVVTVWDRRFARGIPAGEPALLFNRSADEFSRGGMQISHLRYSNLREGAFAVLNAGGGLRVYETSKILNAESATPVGIIGSDSGTVESHKTRGGWRDSAASLLEAGRGAYGGGGGGTSTSGTRTPNPRYEGGETLVVNRINDLAYTNRSGKGDQRITCFDWMLEGRGGGAHSGALKILAVKGDGSLGIIRCPGPAPSIAWGSRNEFAVTCENDLQIMSTTQKKSEQPEEPEVQFQLRPRRKSISELEDDHAYSGGESPDTRTESTPSRRQRANSIVRPEDFLLNAQEVLQNDICVVMRKRVEAGYMMDCKKNAALARKEENPYLEDMWIWLDGAHECAKDGGMMTETLNLSYLGVLGIWTGGRDPTPESRVSSNRRIRKEDWTAACADINKRCGRKKFDSSRCKTAFPEQRRLCLAICGTNFEETEQLEAELQRLEANEEHSKAAGLAMFHGKIDRCIRALQRGGRALKLMSTAVAGYYAARDHSLPANSTWKELAGEMANELGDPYQRAIFAYIANSDWREVLDEIGVPIRERIGIALRWLDDDELTNYLESTTNAAIRGGELEGIILTGVTGEAVQLLQEYINRTGDVQTAALVAPFSSPRFFSDERVDYWIESYRQLLNSWRLFHARAKFDVSRGAFSRDRRGVMTTPQPQRQVYVRCANCDRSISHHTTKKDLRLARNVRTTAAKPTVCPHCKKSLPRCAVCLLTLGTVYYREDEKSADVERDYDRWFNFCLSCNHGMHAGHAKDWFSRHKVCPVPDCECSCKM